MAKTPTPTKIKRLSRKGRVPIHFRVPPEIAEILKYIAKENGMSYTLFTTVLMERLVKNKKFMKEALLRAKVEKRVKVEKIVKKELEGIMQQEVDRALEPYRSVLEKRISDTDKLNQSLNRIFRDPEDETGKEENIN